MKSTDNIISCKNVSIHLSYKIPAVRFQKPVAKSFEINNLSFSVKPHEIIGLYGPNGSGKSTLLRLIAGILKPDSGTISVSGSVAPVIELGLGFHPDMSGMENILLYGSIIGCSEQLIQRKLAAIIQFSELGEDLYLPIKKYSSGMVARLALAVALHSDADIVLLDEALSVGDADFVRKTSDFVLSNKRKRTYIITSHSIPYLLSICDRIFSFFGSDQHYLMNFDAIEAIKDMYSKTAVQKGLWHTALSDSMAPAIKKGDRIFIKAEPFRTITPGDVIAFNFPNYPHIFIHRVIIKSKHDNKSVAITKGDANLSVDPFIIYASHYIGKIKKVVHR